MKVLARCLVVFFILGLSMDVYAQNWIPYQQPVVYTQNIVEQTYIQPVVVYNWVPYVIQQNIVVEQRCLFYKTQRIVTVPQTQWIYQPTVELRPLFR